MILVLARNEETRKRAATDSGIARTETPEIVRFNFQHFGLVSSLFSLALRLAFRVDRAKKLSPELDYKFIHETFSMLEHGAASGRSICKCAISTKGRTWRVGAMRASSGYTGE